MLKDNIKRKDFTKEELNTLFSQDELKLVREIYGSQKMIETMRDACRVYHILNLETEDNVVLLKAFMREIVTKIQNNIEFFAMGFHHNVADETVVFHSLHQSYIGIMDLIYYHVALDNDSEFVSEKLFTNAIGLYNDWKERADKEKVLKQKVLQAANELIEEHKKVIKSSNEGTIL